MKPFDPLAALDEDTEPFEIVNLRSGKLVVHANVLSLARYRFNSRAQKLLFRLIANLDQSSDHLKVHLTLADFAKTIGSESNDVIFKEFLDSAKELMGKFLVVKRAPIPGEKQPRQLICHWVSSQETNPNDKTITFSFDPDLKPYLLKLKQDYVSYPFIHILNFDSSYSMRLYDTLKAFQYRNQLQEFPVSELREILGTSEFDAQGKVINETLQRYFDFKRVAIKPAVREINDKSDILVSFREIKKPGTKTVEKLVFELKPKEGPGTYDIITMPKEPQIELPLNGKQPSETVDFDHIRDEFGLNASQINKIASYQASHGDAYILEKLQYTRDQRKKQKCANPTAFLLAALRDNYTKATKSKPPVQRPRAAAAAPAPEMTDEDFRHRRKLAKQMVQQFKATVS